MTKILVPAALALAATVAAVAPAPRQFDLICDGVAGHYDRDLQVHGQPWHRRYSIDLDRAAFCRREGAEELPDEAERRCGQVSALGIEPGRLVFSGDEDVRRADGRMTFVDPIGRAVHATCTPAPFTPMPANRF